MTPRPRRTATSLLAAAVLLTACSGGAQHDKKVAASAGAKASAAVVANADQRSVTKLIQTGITQAEGKHLTAAETTFGNALVLDPGNKYALYNLGLIAQTQRQDALAVRYYDQALVTDPTYTPAMYNKAIVLEATDLSGAAKIYQQIVARDPKASTAYLRLGFAYSTLGQTAQAKAARAKALALDPSLASVPAPTRS